MKLSKLFCEDEFAVRDTFKDVLRVSGTEFGLVKGLDRIIQYYDEPKPWQYSVSVNKDFIKNNGHNFRSVASGLSFFSEKLAIFKCLCEAMERFCNHAFFANSTNIVETYELLKNKAYDPRKFTGFSKKQLTRLDLQKHKITNNSRFTWTEGYSLFDDEKILIPSQLIYLSYPHLSDEPTIAPGISTGTAGGSCLSAALIRGIYEIIERDAFMIFYLNKLKAPRIPLDKIINTKIQKLLQITERYKMEIYSFDITTDIQVPTFLSIIINRTGIGKAVATGLKSSLNKIDALVGSIEESFNSRTWLRTEYENNPIEIDPTDLLKDSDIRTRGFLWYPKDVIERLDFLLKSPKIKSLDIDKEINKPSGIQLKLIYSLFKNKGYDILCKDITVPAFRKLNYFVAKTIIPQMQPFYLDESYKLLGGNRLYEVPKYLGFECKEEIDLNSFPHPFL